MASIYATTKSGAGYTWQLRLDYTTTQNEESNSSTIACDLWVKPGSSGGYNLNSNSAYYVICGEKKYKTYDFDSTAWVKLGSRTFTVEHEEDGTKSYTLSASWVSNLSSASNYTPASISLSETVELPQINRGTVWVKKDGTWHRAVPWVNVNGTWNRAVPFVKKDGTWHRAV